MKNLQSLLFCTKCRACLPLEKFLKRRIGNKITFVCPICKSQKVIPVKTLLRKYLTLVQSTINNATNIWKKLSDILDTCERGLNLTKLLDENDIYVPEKIVNELINIEAKADNIVNLLLKTLKTCEVQIDRLLKFGKELVDFTEGLTEISEDLQKINHILPHVKNLAEKVQEIMGSLEEREKLMEFEIKVPNNKIEKIFKAIKIGTTTLIFTNLSLIVITKKKRIIRIPLPQVEVKKCMLSKVMISSGKTKVKIKTRNPQQVLEKILRIREKAQTVRIKNIRELLEERHLMQTHNLKEVRLIIRRINEKTQRIVDIIGRILNEGTTNEEITKEKVTLETQTILTRICS